MKILILSSGNSGGIASFVKEQGDSLATSGLDVSYFQISGKGYLGYMSNLGKINETISLVNPDLIHAHYGLSALIANLQRRVPVVSTFHGSDIFLFKRNRVLSEIAHLLSEHSILVNSKMQRYLIPRNHFSVIPCGVNINNFFPADQYESSRLMKLPEDRINILFSSRFDYYEKNYPLARAAMKFLGSGYNLIELKGYSRTEVNLLFNGCDLALMTSFSEGSPLFIKEAMACNCPIVSTDIGDVKELIFDLEGNYITSFNPEDIAEKIRSAVEFRNKFKQTKGRDRILSLGLDADTISKKLLKLYWEVLKLD